MRFAKRSQAAGPKKGSLAERFLFFLIIFSSKRFLLGRRDVGRLPVAAALGVGGKAARPSSRIGTVGGKAGAGRKAGEAPRRNEAARGWAGFCGKVLCHVSTHG